MKTTNNNEGRYIKRAVDYVRENKTWSKAEESVALEKMELYRCSLDVASPYIINEIYDLLEEFGKDNNLPNRWWREYINEEGVFFLLGYK